MDKRLIIDDIFKRYHKRLSCLKSINFMISNSKDKQVVNETKEVYSTNKINSKKILDFDPVHKKKRELERKVDLRNLLFDQLNQEEQKICNMRFDRNMKVSEMAQILYISEATYYRKLKNIYRKLINYYDLFEALFCY